MPASADLRQQFVHLELAGRLIDAHVHLAIEMHELDPGASDQHNVLETIAPAESALQGARWLSRWRPRREWPKSFRLPAPWKLSAHWRRRA
jgi:hypothetical protein